MGIHLTLLLLRAGAKVNQARNSGATPLYIAAEKGHNSCVEVLLDAGAKVDQAKQENHDATPLFIAAYHGHEKCVELLLNFYGHFFVRFVLSGSNLFDVIVVAGSIAGIFLESRELPLPEFVKTNNNYS